MNTNPQPLADLQQLFDPAGDQPRADRSQPYTPLTQAEQEIRRLELLADPRYLLARRVFKAALAAGRTSDQAESEARRALRQAEHGAGTDEAGE